METTQVTAPAVRKTITVNADQQRAFEVFTTEFDSWWPRSHHIGKSPMTKAVIEGRAGGRLYSAQEDGTDCQWGTMLVWEPPHRFVWAWQIDAQWQGSLFNVGDTFCTGQCCARPGSSCREHDNCCSQYCVKQQTGQEWGQCACRAAGCINE